MNIKDEFLKFKQKEAFNPSIFSIVKPDFFDRKILYKAVKNSKDVVTGNVLDVGCATKPYKKLFNFYSYIGIDIDNNPGHPHDHKDDIDIYYDGVNIPFPDNHFDTIVCFQVIEHVRDLDKLIAEMRRVLKKDGKILATFPFVWGLHELPNDYRRLTTEGSKKIFNDKDFKIITYKKLGDNLASFFLIVQLYAGDIVSPLPKVLRILLMIPVCITANILGILFSFVKTKTFYVENYIVVQK